MKYYTTKEIEKLLKVTRDRVSKIARSRGWKFEEYKVGNVMAKRYSAIEVADELNARQRTELLRRTDWLKIQGSQLVRDDTYDTTCPICGGYAVEKPPANGIEAAQPAPWLCENGHAA